MWSPDTSSNGKNKKSLKQWYANSLSSVLWNSYASFPKLPFLTKELAGILAGLGLTIGLGLAGLLVAIQITTGKKFDPIVVDNPVLMLLLSIIPLLVTALMAQKELFYYYGGKGPKDGIFINAVRQASNREQTMDCLIAFFGLILMGFSIIPSYWLLMFSLFSFFVACRSYFALSRTWLYEEQKKDDHNPPRYVFESINGTFLNPHIEPQKLLSPLDIKSILAGWVISHSVYMFYGIAGFCITIFLQSYSLLAARVLAYLIILAIIPLYWIAFRERSYRWGSSFASFLIAQRGIKGYAACQCEQFRQLIWSISQELRRVITRDEWAAKITAIILMLFGVIIGFLVAKFILRW